MSEAVATPAASVPRETGSSQTAANIVKGITDKSNGKTPAAGQPPINGQQPPVEKPADPNAGKEKYVVEGKEVWLTPDQARSYVQKGLAFEPKMDQLARLQQETVQFQRALINDPLTVLKNLAQQRQIPIAKLYEKVLEGDWPEEVKEIVGKKYYHNAVEPLNMTPEQLKAREDAKYREQRENQDKLAQENAIKAANHQRFVAALSHLKAQVGEAMKESGLPDNSTPLGAEMAWMVAKVMQLADKRKQALTPKQAIELVKQHRIRSVQNAYYENLLSKEDDGESLANELGEKIVGRIQKYLLKKAKSGAAGSTPPIVPNGKSPAVRNGERKTINMDDFHDYLDDIKKRG